MSDPYRPIRRAWSLGAIQESAGPEAPLTPAPGGAEGRVWADLVAEYDARLLMDELVTRGPHSPGMEHFLAAWAADEERHTDGLTWLYCRAFGVDPAEVGERLASRAGRFDSFEGFLDDEFRLATMVAYDEAMSTHGYGADLPFYSSLGRTGAERAAYASLLRELRADEAMHYRNAVELLAEQHADRAGEVAGVMDEVIALDAAQDEYQGAFLLDHASDQFSEGSMRRVGRAVAGTIERRLAAAVAGG